MKNFLFVFIASVFMMSFSKIDNSNTPTNYTKEIIKLDCKYGQCQATAKSTGKQCKHCVSNSGDKFCYQHK